MSTGHQTTHPNLLEQEHGTPRLNLLKKPPIGTSGKATPPCATCRNTTPLHCMDWVLLRSVLAARGQDRLDAFTRHYALQTGQPGHGQELVETTAATWFWQELLDLAKLPQLFRPIVQMDSLETRVPYELGPVNFYTPSGEGVAVTSTDLTTGSKSLHAYRVKATVDISDELADDALPLAIPSIKNHLVQKAARCVDDLILSADVTGATSNINYYGAAIASDSRYLLGFDGLIHQALVDAGNKVDVGVLDATKYLAVLAKLGKYAEEPERCAFITDYWTYLKTLGLAEHQTIDKSRPVLAGQVGTVCGIPILCSSVIPKSDLNGRVDGATPGNNTKGRIVCVHRGSWLLGYRTGFQTETERSASTGLVSLTITLRVGLVSFGTASTATHTSLGYNITV